MVIHCKRPKLFYRHLLRDVFHYSEGKLTAMRLGPWKWHFATVEDYYGNIVGRSKPLVFNIRMDPFESYDSTDSYGHLLQKVSWMVEPIGELMKEHLKTLAEYPPVQGGKSFDMSNVVRWADPPPSPNRSDCCKRGRGAPSRA
jgi:C-terminal region of aryl-sulfatase